ncbi:F5/8 type C domain protein [Planctomycetes bacterium CA13]|uniref:F5/8 type C domain protein n=1 Tax=Novipirellula herctigrandis TaxID=2527986 RepID=A0A5C5ZAL9_9BACT|nr:F5/8 type C domain protein [Planctomycetes bacterium CA13]
MTRRNLEHPVDVANQPHCEHKFLRNKDRDEEHTDWLYYQSGKTNLTFCRSLLLPGPNVALHYSIISVLMNPVGTILFRFKSVAQLLYPLCVAVCVLSSQLVFAEAFGIESKSTQPPSDGTILAFAAGDRWPVALEPHTELLEEVLKAGPPSKPDAFAQAMVNLAAILKADLAVASNHQRMRTAVAVAMEFTRKYVSRDENDAVARFQWYSKAQAEGQLHPSFDELETWERRFVVNIPWHHGNGDTDELDWLNREAKLPPHEYCRACWQAPYRGHNPFGETVQGPLYYVPFENELKAFEMRREVGAVCGGLSHFGAAAARANGIGATTMGEPGHCAYAIRIDGEWLPSYSLSSDRTAHQTLLRPKWPYVVLQDKVFADPNRTLAATRLALWAAMLKERDPRRAASLLIRACEIQPNNPLLWESRFEVLQRAGLNEPAKWWDQARRLGQGLKGYPSVVVDTINRLDKKNGVFSDPAQRGRMLAAGLTQAIGVDAPASPAMNWTKMYDQVYALSGEQQTDQANVCRAIAANIIRGPDAQRFVEDALQRFGHSDDIVNFVMDATLESLKSRKSLQGDKRQQLIEACMISAANRRDPLAFQRLAAMHPAPFTENLDYPKDPFSAELVSLRGSIRTSSTSSWDRINGHASVLGIKGGQFHTGKATDEWCEITLPGVAKLDGMIIENTTGNRPRAVPFTIEISADGEKWEEVKRVEETAARWRIDLEDGSPSARFIRINGSVGREDFLHFRRILIYGKPQS